MNHPVKRNLYLTMPGSGCRGHLQPLLLLFLQQPFHPYWVLSTRFSVGSLLTACCPGPIRTGSCHLLAPCVYLRWSILLFFGLPRYTASGFRVKWLRSAARLISGGSCACLCSSSDRESRRTYQTVRGPMLP